VGLPPDSLRKSLVAVVSLWNEVVPGHNHLQPLDQAVKLVIAEAGGTPCRDVRRGERCRSGVFESLVALSCCPYRHGPSQAQQRSILWNACTQY
jgi:hypothetical protein